MPVHPIPPVYNSDSRILILGSFPSVKSRETGFFYGHPQNRFWRVLSSVLKEPLPNSIPEKTALVLKNGIALWDVIGSCDITGSSDASIRNVEVNDVSSIIKNSRISAIYCNGTKAYTLYNQYLKPLLQKDPSIRINVNAVLLPSTSPANAIRSENELAGAWKRILIGLERSFPDDLRSCYRLTEYSLDQYGKKLYKLSLDGGFTCPTRDGTKGTRGCIFCSGGSGSFAGAGSPAPISEQLSFQKKLIKNKLPARKSVGYIAYFQSYTGTYASPYALRKLYYEAITDPEVEILSIATRPDCLPEDVLDLLREINSVKPVWIELGLQSSRKATAEYIRRGYDLKEYDLAVRKLNRIGITQIITHVILGLPGETERNMLDTVMHAVSAGTTGIKFQLLHVLSGTDLAKEYALGRFQVLSFEEYCHLLKSCISLLPPDVVVHRMTGDGDKKQLIAPLWSADKKAVINGIAAMHL